MTDDDVIDAEYSQELIPASVAPATLFRTDDPVEIVARATDVAKALSDVLKQQGLTQRIKDKDYVKVEGWTLCGTMLGVFPVVEWTRPVEGGWEARVEARTRDGAVVGAAEAECLRSENRWSTADDYSIRSMAQTRAISKALRAPLGFIVALAGYETTPEEEMVRPENRPFDPSTDLLPGAISGADAPKRLAEAFNRFDPTVEWGELFEQIAPGWRQFQGDNSASFWRRVSNAERWITDHTPAGDFPPIDAVKIVAGFTYAFGEVAFQVPYKEPAEAPLTADEARRADEAIATDDIPFGDENSG